MPKETISINDFRSKFSEGQQVKLRMISVWFVAGGLMNKLFLDTGVEESRNASANV